MAISENAKKLNEEELKDANGGYLYQNPRTGLWNVVDGRNGRVVAAYASEAEANRLNKINAYEKGMGTVSEGILEHLRQQHGITVEEQFGEFYYM